MIQTIIAQFRRHVACSDWPTSRLSAPSVAIFEPVTQRSHGSELGLADSQFRNSRSPPCPTLQVVDKHGVPANLRLPAVSLAWVGTSACFAPSYGKKSRKCIASDCRLKSTPPGGGPRRHGNVRQPRACWRLDSFIIHRSEMAVLG